MSIELMALSLLLSLAVPAGLLAASLIDRATIYSDQGDTQRALADIERALKIDPRNASAFSARGAVLARAKNHDGAIAAYG